MTQQSIGGWNYQQTVNSNQDDLEVFAVAEEVLVFRIQRAHMVVVPVKWATLGRLIPISIFPEVSRCLRVVRHITLARQLRIVDWRATMR